MDHLPKARMPVQKHNQLPNRHIGYLDGLRGLAALYVVLGHLHAYGMELIGARPGGSATHLQAISKLLNLTVLGYAHFAVDLFIVLSGYCLMLPVAQSPDGVLRGGLSGYFRRRSLRILPPYFAALAVSLVAMMLTPGTALPTRGALVSHLLLLHDFNPHWLYSIDAPMWSVAVEWHIYFIFALLLLPVWRRFGSAAALAVALVAGILPHYVLPEAYNLEWAFPWYIGLFGLGMIASVVGFRQQSRLRAVGQRAPWGWLALSLILLTLLLNTFELCNQVEAIRWLRWLRAEHWGSAWPIDLTAGAAAASALIWLTNCAKTRKSGGGVTLRVLNAPIVVLLGSFSYSLYLIHYPFVYSLSVLLRRAHVPPAASYFAMFGIGLPICVGIGYLFFLGVEKRLLTSSRKLPSNAADSTLASGVSPADSPAREPVLAGAPELRGLSTG